MQKGATAQQQITDHLQSGTRNAKRGMPVLRSPAEGGRGRQEAKGIPLARRRGVRPGPVALPQTIGLQGIKKWIRKFLTLPKALWYRSDSDANHPSAEHMIAECGTLQMQNGGLFRPHPGAARGHYLPQERVVRAAITVSRNS